MRLVRPEAEKAVPMTTEPKMNQTEGSRKSPRASLAETDIEEHLEQADGDGGDADGHNLKDPPDPGHEKEAQGHLARPGQLKDLSPRINRIRQTGNEIKQDKDSQTQEDKNYAFVVNRHLFGRKFDLFGHLRQAGAYGHFLNIFGHDS